MKLFVAAAVIALAKQASAFLVTQDHNGDYCVMVVPYDGTDWGVDADGTITGLPGGSTVTTDGDASATVAQNGLNDPTDAILTDTLQATWDTWRAKTVEDSTITIYEAGTTTPIDPQPENPSALGANADLGWCKFYSTLAPDHYCKADGAVESWQVSTITSTATFSACCASNHASMETECFEASSGVVAPGSGDWYADYENNKCVRDCDVGNLFEPGANTLHSFADPASDTSYECGGLPSWDGVTTYTTVENCCKVFTSLQSEYCVWSSTLGSAPAAGDYPGSVGAGATDGWYPDSSNSICLQDCPTDSTFGAANGATCGGTVTAASIPLFDSETACCDAAVSWESDGCAARSSVGPDNPTNLFWASSEGCRKDCDPAGGSSANCETAPSTAKLYQTDAECCKQANAWVDYDYCISRAVQNTVTGSNQWYVVYEDGVCRKDCDTTGANSPCELADHGSHQFFDSSDACCKATLAYVDQGACVEASNTGLTISTVATLKWYVVSGGDQPCAKDCDTSVGNECGGIVAKTGIRMYDSETECCKQAYSWVNQDLCEKLSLNTATPHTNLWYVSYGSNACHKDCAVDAANNPECKGTPDDTSIHMYDTAANCCKSKLNWMDSERCVTASTTGVDPTDGDSPGTGEWRKNDSWSYCVLDCTAGEAIATGDPIITVDPLSVLTPAGSTLATQSYPDQCDGVSGDSSASMYGADLSACCKSVNWVQAETCESLSTGEKTMMFFADPSDGKKCVVHQVADTSGLLTTPAIQCGSGVVTEPSANIDDPNGVTCEPEIQTSTKLYTTLQKCCEANVPWDEDACFYNSKGASAPGTLKYYVDWSKMKCVQDCPDTDTNLAACGGIAESWDTLFASSTACCDRLTWVKRQDCIYTGA